MSAFSFFYILMNFLDGIIAFLVGLFLWKNFQKDYEYRTIGGTLALISPMFLIIAIRVFLSELGLVSEILAFEIFFFEYVLLIFLLFLFLPPRMLYLVLNKKNAEKIGLVLGLAFFLIFFLTFLKQRENVAAFHTVYGLVFTLPFFVRIYLVGVIGFLLLIMTYRLTFLFYQWRNKKIFPYRFYIYLSLFFIFLSSLPFFFRFAIWKSVLGLIGIFAGILATYFFVSQEKILKEESK